jgi:hypothetical protein
VDGVEDLLKDGLGFVGQDLHVVNDLIVGQIG